MMSSIISDSPAATIKMADHHGNNGQVSERSRTESRPLHPEGAGRMVRHASLETNP